MAIQHAPDLAADRPFNKSLPYEITPTNIPGIYTSPSPPAGFDPHTASSRELARYGLLLHRPVKGRDPDIAVTAWERAFAQAWLPENRVVPHLEPHIGVTHNNRAKIIERTNSNISSSNWAGGVVSGNWSSAVGTWTVPTVSKPTESQGTEGGWHCSSWVGIDGTFSSNDVLQGGVDQRVDSNGNTVCFPWFEWFVPIVKTTLADRSPLTPALASLSGRLYIAWKGDGNDDLNVMVSTDGGASFHNKITSGETSPKAPALAAHNGALYIAWKGDGNDFLNIAQVKLDNAGSPTGLFNKVILSVTSPLSPSLASVNGHLYLAFRGDGNDGLNVMVSLDNGLSFGSRFNSAETSAQAPVLGTFKGNLMIAWQGDAKDDRLNVAQVVTNPAPTGFTGKVTLGETSPQSPALGEYDGRLYLAWKGDGNDALNIISSPDGQNFALKTTSTEVSPVAPSLVSHNGDILIGWKGDGNNQLNVADVGDLLVPSYVFEVQITNLPVKPGDSVTCLVQYIGQTAGQVTFTNQTTGKHSSVTLVPPPGAAFEGNTAEWIVEAPDGGLPISALPRFTPVAFTLAMACSANGTIGDPAKGDTFFVRDDAVTPSKALTSTTLAASAVTVSFIG